MKVKAKIKKLYPIIAKDQIDNAVADTLKNAYKTLITDNPKAGDIENFEGYVYSVLANGDNVGKFIPGKYFPLESYYQKA